MTFVVFGAPATKGSTVSFMGDHGIVTKTDSTGLGAWTQAVGWMARTVRVPLLASDVPVRVTVEYQFLRPKSAKGRVYPTVRPDLDKLERALLDALTGVAYHDDAQVVAITSTKVYGDDARTTVCVEAMP